MAFVNEIIPEEEKEKFTFPVSTRADGSKPTLWKWTIDREREAYLILSKVLGGGYEGTEPVEYLVLIWRDQLITFCGENKVSGNRQDGYSVTWHITDLNIPGSLQDRKAEVLELIREALDVKGLDFVRLNLKAIAVNF